MHDESTQELEKSLEQLRQRFDAMRAEIARAIVGHEDVVLDTLTAILSRGHILLESVPGLGKTYLVRVVSTVLGLSSGRVQCTPDLMPTDILGTHVVEDDQHGKRRFRFEPGPVFRHLVLVDEINRATSKTQAALLEAMQEHTVTAGNERFPLPNPFFVLATQNPLEMEGTYPLPEAQLDRFFFKLKLPFPSLPELIEISNRTTGTEEIQPKQILSGNELLHLQQEVRKIPVADPVTEYAGRIVLATHPDTPQAHPSVSRYISYGASPRGLQALIRGAKVRCALDGRTAVAVADIRDVAHQALRHRMILNFEGEADSVNADTLIDQILEAVPAPARIG